MSWPEGGSGRRVLARTWAGGDMSWSEAGQGNHSLARAWAGGDMSWPESGQGGRGLARVAAGKTKIDILYFGSRFRLKERLPLSIRRYKENQELGQRDGSEGTSAPRLSFFQPRVQPGFEIRAKGPGHFSRETRCPWRKRPTGIRSAYR